MFKTRGWGSANLNTTDEFSTHAQSQKFRTQAIFNLLWKAFPVVLKLNIYFLHYKYTQTIYFDNTIVYIEGASWSKNPFQTCSLFS